MSASFTNGGDSCPRTAVPSQPMEDYECGVIVAPDGSTSVFEDMYLQADHFGRDS